MPVSNPEDPPPHRRGEMQTRRFSSSSPAPPQRTARSVSGEMRYRVQRSFAADEADDASAPPLKHRARRTETAAPR